MKMRRGDECRRGAGEAEDRLPGRGADAVPAGLGDFRQERRVGIQDEGEHQEEDAQERGEIDKVG